MLVIRVRNQWNYFHEKHSETKKNLIEREFLASENIENNVIFRFLPNHFFFQSKISPEKYARPYTKI